MYGKLLVCVCICVSVWLNTGRQTANPQTRSKGLQGSHYILVLKFKDFSRTLMLHFQGLILDGSLQHGQQYLISISVITGQF